MNVGTLQNRILSHGDSIVKWLKKMGKFTFRICRIELVLVYQKVINNLSILAPNGKNQISCFRIENGNF